MKLINGTEESWARGRGSRSQACGEGINAAVYRMLLNVGSSSHVVRICGCVPEELRASLKMLCCGGTFYEHIVR
jgi:hypothetical protein